MGAKVISMSGRRMAKDHAISTETSLAINYEYESGTNLQLYIGIDELNKKSDLILEMLSQGASATNLVKPILQENKINISLSPKIMLLNKIASIWRLSDDDTCMLLGFDIVDTDYVAEILSGQQLPRSRDFQDRIRLIYDMRKSLHALFRDEDAENSWLRELCPALDNKSPLDFMLSGGFSGMLLLKNYIDIISGY